ncbi:MAG: hypothetical protein M3016_09815, partial [Actinomycetota bacterium]|nr:hypothetical protein [Actinomycetota bacterium]
MSDAWPAIKVRDFEHVVTGPSKSLLRVSGQGPRRRDSGHRPALIISARTGRHRFSALPAPPDQGRLLRAAYAVSTELVQDARAFWL